MNVVSLPTPADSEAALASLLADIRNRPNTRAALADLRNRPLQFPQAEPDEAPGYDVDYDSRRQKERERKARYERRKRAAQPRIGGSKPGTHEPRHLCSSEKLRIAMKAVGARYTAARIADLSVTDRDVLRLLASEPRRIWRPEEMLAGLAYTAPRIRRRRKQLSRWDLIEMVPLTGRGNGWRITARGVAVVGKVGA